MSVRTLIDAVIPDQRGNSGKVLSTDGAGTLSWITAGGGGGGVTTMGAFGSTPNANAGTISGTTLTLQPASASFPGGVSTAAQTFAGAKTFANALTVNTADASPILNVEYSSTPVFQVDGSGGAVRTYGALNVGQALAGAPTFITASGLYSNVGGGNTTLAVVGVVTTSGSAIAAQLGSYNNLTTAGDKLLSVQNNIGGTPAEKAYVDKDGVGWWASGNTTLNNLLPTQTGNSGNFLTTNGTNSSWSAVTVAGALYDGAWFGDGIDGNATITTTVTLTADKYYNNLTISGSGSLVTNGWRVHVNGTLDISAAPAEALIVMTDSVRNGTAGSLNNAGNPGSGLNDLQSLPGTVAAGSGAPGANNSAGSTGTQGSVSGITNGGSQTKPGGGGAGTLAGGGQASVTANTVWNLGYITTLICKQASVTSFTLIHGGAPGSGGGSGGGNATPNFGGGGGGGGSGGGTMWLAARTIARGTNSTAGIITVAGGKGGNGANGGTGNATGGGGGGSGGGGGQLYLIYGARTGSVITNCIDLSGGTGGNGGTGGTGGNGGGGGGSGGSGIAHVFDFSAGTNTYTAVVAGTDGDAGQVGTAGSAGKTNVQRINL